MANNEELTSLGSWLVQNQHLQGSEDYNTVAQAFQQLDTQAQHETSQKAQYGGIGGAVRAYGGQVLPGLAGGVGQLADLTNHVNPIYYAMKGLGIMPEGTAQQATEGFTRNLVGAPEISDLPENVRPYGYAGRATGEALSSMLAPEAALAGVAKGGATGMKLLDTTAKSIADKGILKNVATAAPMAGMSGFGTAVADQIAPDNELGHAIGGLVGAVTHPVGAARALGGKASNVMERLPGGQYLVQKARTALDPEAATAGNLAALMEEHAAKLGGNADVDIANVIKDLTGPMAQGPAHTRTLNPVVQDLAAHLASKDVNTGRAFQEAADAAQANRVAIAQSQIGGDAEKLFPAVQQRVDEGAARVGAIQQRQGQRATQAGEAIQPSVDAQTAAGERLNANMQAMHSVYGQNLDSIQSMIDRSAVLGPTSGVQYRASVNNRINGTPGKAALPDDHPGQNLMASLNQVSRRDATVGDYLDLRSRAGQASRDFYEKGNKAAGDFYGNLVDRIDSTLTYRSGAVPTLQYVPTFNKMAREKADVFERGPAGSDLFAYGRKGSTANVPETTAERVLTGQPVRQGENVEHIVNRATADPMLAEQDLSTAQLGKVGPRNVDQVTGRPSPEGIARELGTHQPLYNQLPTARTALEGAQGAATAAARADMRAEQFHKLVQSDKSAVSGVLGRAETPEGLITEALGKKNPEAYLESLYKTARRAGPDGLEGLSGVVNRYIGTGENAVDKAANILRPVNAKTGNVADWMLKKGLIDQQRHAAITGEAQHVVKNADAMVRAKAQAVDPTSKTPDYVDIASRIFGASAGNKLSGLMGGHTLISAQVGSKYARKLAGSMGLPSQINMLNAGIENPEQLAALFRKAQEQRAAKGFTPPSANGAVSPQYRAVDPALWSLLAVKGEQGSQNAPQKRRPAGLLN